MIYFIYMQHARLDVGLHELNSRLVQQENVCIHDASGCTTSCTTGCIMYTNIQLVVQQVVSCKRGVRKGAR